MKKLPFALMILMVSGWLFMQSCEKEENNTISRHGSNASHNNGQNCMNCHTTGPGSGIFLVAGSVYDSASNAPYADATIKLYSSGFVIKTIEVDAKGNFYTIEAVDFSTPVSASVTGISGSTRNMLSEVPNGQCNSCHGVTVQRIWVD